MKSRADHTLLLDLVLALCTATALMALSVGLAACAAPTPQAATEAAAPASPAASGASRVSATVKASPSATSEPATPAPSSTPAPSPTGTPPPATAAQPASPAGGLGVGARDAQRLFQFLEFEFADEGNRWLGTISDGLAVVELAGSPEDIGRASVTVTVPRPPTEKQAARTIAYLSALLTTAAPDWAEGTDWLSASLNNAGESRAMAGDREAILVVTLGEASTTSELTIRALGAP